MIGTTVFFCFAVVPVTLPVIPLVYGLLTGRISATGLWCDSFAPDQFSPTRVLQFILVVLAAATVLIDLGKSGWTAFAPLPPWLYAAAGGGNFVYLGAKYAAARRSAANNG
jgi:hypothetical protein